jgi:hypothetical protein
MERTAAEVKGSMVATYCAECTRKMGSHSKTVHVLDLLCEPEMALNGRSPVAGGHMTYLYRLRLKGHFRKTIHASASRERTYWAGERPKGVLCRALVLFLGIGLMVLVSLIPAVYRMYQKRHQGAEPL